MLAAVLHHCSLHCALLLQGSPLHCEAERRGRCGARPFTIDHLDQPLGCSTCTCTSRSSGYRYRSVFAACTDAICSALCRPYRCQPFHLLSSATFRHHLQSDWSHCYLLRDLLAAPDRTNPTEAFQTYVRPKAAPVPGDLPSSSSPSRSSSSSSITFSRRGARYNAPPASTWHIVETTMPHQQLPYLLPCPDLQSDAPVFSIQLTSCQRPEPSH